MSNIVKALDDVTEEIKRYFRYVKPDYKVIAVNQNIMPKNERNAMYPYCIICQNQEGSYHTFSEWNMETHLLDESVINGHIVYGAAYAPYNPVDLFESRTNALFRPINDTAHDCVVDADDIATIVRCLTQDMLDSMELDEPCIAKKAVVYGSRSRGIEHEGSDLDVVVEVDGNVREDWLFDLLHENVPTIGGIEIDINPITPQKTGTLETYLPQAERYLTEKFLAQKENEKAKACNMDEPKVGIVRHRR